MGKNFTAAFAVCLAISSLPLACGDDEDEPSGGKGGSATGGSSGKGGSSGSDTGGTSGKGGTGGKGGTAGSAGKGGTSGQGGTAGTGGTDGGMGGAEGGMGGEGGSPDPQTLCERVCAVTESLDCTSEATCPEDACEAYYTTPDCKAEIDAIMTCFAEDTALSDWACDTKSGLAAYGGTACDAELTAAADAFCL